MANEKSSIVESRPTDRLTETALDLFKNSRQGNGSPKQLAIRCYRDAAAFLEATDEIQSGKLSISVIDNNPLDEACAPNLKKTHPVNLISRQYGKLEKVAEAYEHVRVTSVEAYEPLNWGKPECNQARALFPAVLEKAGMLKPSAN